MARKRMEHSKSEDCVSLSNTLKSRKEDAIRAIERNDITSARAELNIIEEYYKDYRLKCIIYHR